MMSTCPTRPSPRRARHALACAAIAALALAACGGPQRSAPTPAAPADVSTPSEEALVVGPDVDADWLGATWDGALERLAANPDAAVGLCPLLPLPTSEDGETAIVQVVESYGQAERERQQMESAAAAPVVRLYRLEDVVSAGLGVSNPRGDEIVVVRVVDEVDAGGCLLRSTDGVRAERLVRGGVMVVRGAASTALVDPGVALRRPDVEVLTMVGWELLDGVWTPTRAPVLAAFAAPAPDAEVVACASDRFDATVLDVLQLWEVIALGSPAPSAQARLRLEALIDPSEPADAFVSSWIADPDPADAAESLGAVDTLMAACPTDPAVRVAAALTYSAAELYEDAAAILLRTWADDRVATRAASQTLVAWLALEAGDDRLAASALDEALAIFPGYRPALLQLGRLQRDRNGDAQGAAATLALATGHTGLDAIAWFELGWTLELLDRAAEAADAFERSAAADPAFPEPTNALGCLAWSHGLHDQARTLFEETTRRDPGFAPAWSNLGFLVENVDEAWDEAESLYRQAIELDASSASAWFNLGYLLEQRYGRLDEAAAAYEAALRVDPEHGEASTALSNLRARPDASVDSLMGAWTATLVDDTDGQIAVLATFLPSGRLTVVERPAGGDARTRRFGWSLDQANGPQLRLQIDEEGVIERMTVEFLAPDRFVMFYPDEPSYARVIFERRVGGDLAGAGATGRGG